MRRLFLLLLLFALLGCSSKELTKAKMADMLIDYYTPYSSTNIFVPQSVDILNVKKIGKDKVVAKICYQFRFLTDYKSLVDYIKKHPNSFLAKFDVGLVSLLGRKFGAFHKGEVKSRCDEVEFQNRHGAWMITRI